MNATAADFDYDADLLALSDDLHRKTLIAFDDTKQGLIKPSHAFAIGEYARLRTIESLNYNEVTGKIRGVAAHFSDSDLFFENREQIFIPEHVTEILETEPYSYLPPRVVNDPARRTAYALMQFSIEQTMKHCNTYGQIIAAQALHDVDQGKAEENPFAFYGRVMQAQMDNGTTWSCLNNLTYGIETALHYQSGTHWKPMANRLSDLVTCMIDMGEEIHARKLGREDVEKLVIWRHIVRRADLMGGLNPQ